MVPTHPLAAAEQIPIEKRASMMSSTLCVVKPNASQLKKEPKFEAIKITRFPNCCDIHPPKRNPNVAPKKRVAPKSYQFKFRGS